MSSQIVTTTSHLRATTNKRAIEKDDVATLAAIGILALICTDLAHEVVGHGLGFLIAGGRSGILTTTKLISESQVRDPLWRIFDLGGPAGNLLWAGLCLLALRLLRRAASPLKLLLWTTMSFSLLWESGYLIFSGVTGTGDDMAMIIGLDPAWGWRTLLLIAGVWLYRMAIRFSSSNLDLILNTPGSARRRKILLTLYLAAGLIACAGAIFDPRGYSQILISGAACSLAANVGFLFMLRLSSASLAGNDDSPHIQRNIGVTLVAAVAAILFIVVLGPGIHFRL
jgi:hypothetical protein